MALANGMKMETMPHRIKHYLILYYWRHTRGQSSKAEHQLTRPSGPRDGDGIGGRGASPPVREEHAVGGVAGARHHHLTRGKYGHVTG
jgi:hypothetical protein